MPLFLSSEEFQSCSNDAALVAEKADAFIQELMNQLETVKAKADAASITAEQTCSLLEQKYVSLSSEFSSLQSQHSQLNASLEERLTEITELRAQNHQIHLLSTGKDGDIERLSTEASELHKSKRQLIELLQQKELEISEKSSIIKSYLDKIVYLTENAASKEARVSELETELARSQASCTRICQEKELIERHNSWLNDELKVKVDNLIELRKAHSELEAEMSAKLADVEKNWNETSSSLKWNKDRVKELESKLASLEQELLSGKDAAATIEKQFSSEISTWKKLVDLYKESSEEWSKKAGELEGVVKALETHLVQVEDDYKQRLESEASARKEIEKEADCLKENFEKCAAELESFKRKDDLKPLPLSSFTSELWVDPREGTNTVEDNRMLLPSIPVGVSGTALAASLLRDGWSLAQLYTKYQEAVDALRHEQLGRKQSQAILERVLYEIEEKAGVILDERAEHERMVEAYSSLNQKLQHSLSEQTALQSHTQELKADLRRHEREYAAAQKEVVDLQKQVSVLLKECRDIQLRGGSVCHDYGDTFMAGSGVSTEDAYNAADVIPEQLLAFKDISGLVEQNVQLRRLVHSLSEDIASRETELKEKYEKELQRHTDEAGSKVNAVLARAEEQACMIESLHTSVAMYKRLYEEAHKPRSPNPLLQEAVPVERGKAIIGLADDSYESLKKAQEKAHKQVKYLDEEFGKSRCEIISLRSECDKLALEAQLAREKLERFMAEYEHQRDEYNGLLARNVEFSQLIIDYQRKLRDSSDSQRAAEELSRKLTMEVSLVKQEKEMLLNAERRAADEIRSLSERAHRLQASLNTIESTEEVREEARCAERKKQELYINQIEREWAEAKKELNEERDRVRNLTLERESSLNNALKQVEEIGKELSKALHALAAAEARASIAEARCSELEEKMKLANFEASEKYGKGGPNSTANNEIVLDLHTAEHEIAKLREEARINKEHMLQYKNIAQASEEALKQLEVAHENSKAEAENFKKSLEAELLSLRQRVTELEEECNLKNKEVEFATVRKEEALAAALSEIAFLKEDCSVKTSQVAVLETQISSLKDDLEKEHQKARAAQANYERQVILQSDTIQELTRTSQALATLQEEASELRKLSDALKTENIELKAKWETEKSVLEVLKNDADAKYNEVNELNKLLHSKLEALHIKLAEKDRHSSCVSGSSSHDSLDDDNGLGHIVNYLRRSKEIAETEISLLKQEKRRLQSQLETALKAAESAQASLNAERANLKTSLFTEEEFKSLQLQVREISLLRESNIQLRGENRHNFEECQKLREALQKISIEMEIKERSLEERQNEVEACRRDIEKQMMEKEDFKRKVDELLEKSKSFDVEDYDRLRESVQQMQVNLREKEAQLEEMKVVLSERQSVISRLEQDVSRSKIERNEKESRINEISQVEASLRSDLEKQRRVIAQLKKKSETLSKEKEDMSKENLVLSKQLEDAKQVKRSLGDAAGEHAMKEKEKEKEKEEKDTRIQILEKTVERLREELKKEKDEHKTEKAKRLKTQKTISDSYETVSQHRVKLLDELEKHKQALRMLVDEVEKLKQSRGNQSEGTTEINFLSGSLLEDLATAYHLAVESFHRSAQPVSVEPGASAVVSSAASDTTSAGPTIVAAMAPAISSPAPSTANVPSAKTVHEKEKKSVLVKPSLETRKTGRKLVRPRIIKPEESQPDILMSELEGSDKPSSSNDLENQGNLDIPTSAPGRKRPSALSTPELCEELLVTDETGADVAEPTLKRSRNSETPQEGGEGLPPEGSDSQAAGKLEDSSEVLPASEESMEDIPDLPHVSKGISVNVDKDEGETAAKQAEEPTAEMKMQEEFQNDKGDVADACSNKLNGALLSDVPLKQQADQEIQHPAAESESEREEGELVTDVADLEGSLNMSTTLGSSEPEFLSEHGTASEIPPGVDDDPVDQATVEAGDAEVSQALDDVKNDEGIITEDIGETSHKLNNDIEQAAAETDEVSEAATTNPEKRPPSTGVEIGVSKQGGASAINDTEEGKQASPIYRSSTTINLSERAKERASIRQGGMLSSLTSRGRGRAPRGRGGRSARGRGQTSGKQG
ncbi:nuclear-pore anchor isoform X2 [Coffea arabica]|uniref:Nuclear-pore anchor isoform X2 n=1 Tax=Coffea arabica TaxID=13443 RepID=A0ABM4UE44_COFAR